MKTAIIQELKELIEKLEELEESPELDPNDPDDVQRVKEFCEKYMYKSINGELYHVNIGWPERPKDVQDTPVKLIGESHLVFIGKEQFDDNSSKSMDINNTD